MVPGHPRLVEEVSGRVASVEVAPVRPPTQLRRRHERNKHDKGLADQGPLGGHARRVETG